MPDWRGGGLTGAYILHFCIIDVEKVVELHVYIHKVLGGEVEHFELYFFLGGGGVEHFGGWGGVTIWWGGSHHLVGGGVELLLPPPLLYSSDVYH